MLNWKTPVVLLGLMGALSQVQAQRSPNYPAYPPVTDTSRYVTNYNPADVPPTPTYPEIGDLTVVNYTTKSIAQFSVKSNGLNLNTLSLAQKGNESTSVPIQAINGTVTLDNLSRNKVFVVRGANSFGQMVTLGEISTFTFKPGEDGVRVSDKLYRHILKYLAAPNSVPLHLYIAQLPDVTTLEKTAFAQSYFTRGAELPPTTIGIYPADYINQVINTGDPDPGDDDPSPCNCNLIINQSSFARPDGDPGGPSIERVSAAANGVWDSSRWWWDTQEAGAAKYYFLGSDGWKENIGANKVQFLNAGTISAQTGNSVTMATLSYTFLCVDYPNALPANCGCDKTIRLSAAYTSLAEGSATIRGGNGLNTKSSKARVKDFAVLFTTQPNLNGVDDVKILAAGAHELLATCSDNASVTQLAVMINQGATFVVDVIKAVKTGSIDDIPNSLQTLTTAISAYIQALNEEKDCSGGTSIQTLIDTRATQVLRPNEPLAIVLASGSEIDIAGKRSWDNYGRIKSDFYLTGVLLGGSPSLETRHCCTDYSAQWVYATQYSPVSQLQAAVNNHLFQIMNGTGSMFVNGLPFTGTNYCNSSEIGEATSDYSGCEIKVPIYNLR